MTGTEVQEASAVQIPHSRQDVWQRILVVAAVSAAPWFPPIFDAVGSITEGSRSVLFVVAPILACILLLNSDPPHGVVDTEVNWIVALLGGAGTLVALALLTDRIPTLTQLWRVDMLGPVVWTAGATAVLLGLRYAAGLWDIWLLLAVCASPLPFLLVAALFGGSDAVLTALACLFSTVVVFRASRRCAALWRVASAAVSLSVGLVSSGLVLTAAPEGQATLLVATVVGAGAIPFAFTFGVTRLAPARSEDKQFAPVAAIPDVSAVSVLVILGLSMAMLLAYPGPPQHPAAPQAADDWATRSGLRASTDFGFAARFLGPYSTITRYTESLPMTSPLAAVDVITTPMWGVLENFADAQWYPSSEPVDYQPMSMKGPWPGSLMVRTAHTNADTAVNPDSPQWYVLSWIWRVKAGFQQITVVVSQHKNRPLPAPSVPSVSQSVLSPLLWIARQQPRQISEVEPSTVELAEQLAWKIVDAAGLGGFRAG